MSTIARRMTARSHKAAAAAAQAAKDKQLKAFQEELGLLLDDDGEALALSTPQKDAARRPVAQSPQQGDGGAPSKSATQVDLDPSTLVLIPTLPPHLLTLASNSLVPAAQDARSTKLPVSLGPSCSPYTESPPRRSRSGDQTRHVALGTPPPFTMLDSYFPTMGGASFESPNSGPTQVRTKMLAQHAAAALSGSRSSSSLTYLVESTFSIPHLTIPCSNKTHCPSLPCLCLQIRRTPSLQRF